MDREMKKKKIEFLVKTYFENFDFLRKEPLDKLQEKAVDKYLDNDLSIEEIQKLMEEEILKRKKVDIEEDNMNSNHNNIYDRLEELIFLLDRSNVNYRVSGGLAGYLKYGEESDRIHNRITIIVDEEDYDKFKNSCDFLGINYTDKGVLNADEDNIDFNDNFYIKASLFNKLEDGSIITKDFEDGNVKETKFSKEQADLIFGGEGATFRNNYVNIIAPEYIYYIKDGSDLEKDKVDIRFLEDKIDKGLLEAIKKSFDIEKERVNDNNSNELTSMIDDKTSVNDVKDNSNTESLQKPKIFVKENPNNENGFSNTLSLYGMSILAFLLTIVSIMIMYLTLR